MKNTVRIVQTLIIGFIAFCTGLMLSHPVSYAVPLFAVTGIPLAVSLWIVTHVSKARKGRKQAQIRSRAKQTLTEYEICEVRKKLDEFWPKPGEIRYWREPLILPPSVVTPWQKNKPLPDLSVKPEQQEPEYVPEGQAELTADLLENLTAQAETAVNGSTWYMNAEWLGEVKKLTDKRGQRLYLLLYQVMPPGYPAEYLLGFPVRAGEEYGSPELKP